MITILLLPLLTSHASLFIYYTVSTSLTPVKPPLQYVDPGSSQVSVNISPTRTNATSVVLMSNTAQIVKNPDFYSSPDNWFCASSTANLSCYWLPSDTGASGGVGNIYGYLTPPSSSLRLYQYSAYLYTNVTFPATQISSIYLIVRSGYWSEAGIITIYAAGLVDPSTGSTVWSQTLNPGQSSYSTDILSVSTSSVSPGKTYVLAIGLTTYLLGLLGGGLVDFRVDSAYLYVITTNYAYSGPVIKLNNTDSNSYYARLILYSSDIDPNLTVNITLKNVNGESSTPIEIKNGSVVQDETSELQLPPPPSGYTSGQIEISGYKPNQTNSTLILSFTYCSEPFEMGVCVTYPFKLVLDPPPKVAELLSPFTHEQSFIEFEKFNISLTNMYNSILKVSSGARDG